ncbi:hypothetical protein FACUT_13474 [Fusarium acutatum]|uniref:Uncharacterized protein n=1 Tax=Fusarium acutatum TaxID=78861 RepID=A0A8H4J974_9HYPO|nr:hypothetical protein FACUT_13474 [Fusarium acutatum]
MSAEDDSETSSGAHEQPETGETDSQSESSDLYFMTVEHDGEGDVSADEVSDEDAPMPSAIKLHHPVSLYDS